MRLRSILSVAAAVVAASAWTGELKSAPSEKYPTEIVPQLGHSGGISALAVSADNKIALSGSYDTVLKLWDLATGLMIREFRGHTAQIGSVSFLPDGRTALSGDWGGVLILWDVATGRRSGGFRAGIQAR